MKMCFSWVEEKERRTLPLPRAQRAHEAPVLHAQLDVDVVIFIILRDGRLQLADALLEFCALGDDTMPGHDGLVDLRVLAFEAGWHEWEGRDQVRFAKARRVRAVTTAAGKRQY